MLGPADDGGYWLIGQRQPGYDLFSGIPWSSPDTLTCTRCRLRSLEVAWSELETLGDIDTGPDLEREIAAGTLDPSIRDVLARVLTQSREPRARSSCLVPSSSSIFAAWALAAMPSRSIEARKPAITGR